jgi:3-oxoacyl-[acyl-carrier protein] reductase
VAIVVGATSDPSIGRSCAFRLAREGASVVVSGRTAATVAETEATLRKDGCGAVGVCGSAEEEGMATQLVDAALDNFGRIDYLVNTVGGSPAIAAPLELDRDGFLATMSLNIWPAVALIQEAMRRGLSDGGGSIVNISSGTVHKTTPSMIAYKAAKTALNAMTETFARKLGPLGVRVNGVAPGLTRTFATKNLWGYGEQEAQSQALRSFTTPDDIAGAVLFLLSDDARQVTGTVIDVDGGNRLAGGGSTPFAPKQ